MTDTMTDTSSPSLPDWISPGEAIRLEADRLVVESGLPERWTGVRADPTLLAPFTRLHRSRDDAAIFAFARRWGLLELCDHGVPSIHPARLPVCLAPPLLYVGSPTRHERAALESEWISTWRYWSAQADAILTVAAAVRRERVGAPAEGYLEAWQELARPMPWGPPKRARQNAAELRSIRPKLIRFDGGDPRRHPLHGVLDVVEGRRHVAQALTCWLELAGGSLEVHWRGEEPTYRRSAPKLFGAIGKELVRAIQESRGGWEVCASCGAEVEVRRRRKDEVLCERCSAARAQARRRRLKLAADPLGWRAAERERVAKARARRRAGPTGTAP